MALRLLGPTMCICLFTTAHPDYALILLDNRDEYTRRPTSRPDWWTHPVSGEAVLTNVREEEAAASSPPGWAGWPTAVSTPACGAWRATAPWTASAAFPCSPGGCGGGTWGLSNSLFDEPWPKVDRGTALLRRVVDETAAAGAGEAELVDALFAILDSDTLPARAPHTSREAYMDQLHHTIFVPPVADDGARQAGGPYATQRQTVVLVDGRGNVAFRERALWDQRGRAIPRGCGDVAFRFRIDGWDDEDASTLS